MAIYYSNHASANDANGGTNATTDAKATFNSARTLYDRTNSGLRDIIACASSPGGSVSFSGTAGFRHFQNNQSLWAVGLNESERMSHQGRAGDLVTFLASSSYWFQYKDVFQYYTWANFILDCTSMTAGDSCIKVFDNGVGSISSQPGLILDNVRVTKAYWDGPKFGPYTDGLIVRQCQFDDYGRVGSNCQGIYIEGKNCLVTQNVSFQIPANVAFLGTGIRLYTNSASIIAGYPESSGNIIERNLVYDTQTGLAFSGNNCQMKNNYICRPTSIGLDVLFQNGGTNNGLYLLNNSLIGILAGSNGFFAFNTGATHSNLEIQNNIFYNFTTPVNLNGATASVNANNLTTDPSYTDAANNDLSIPEGSSARNNGVVRAEVTNDYLGTTRPQGVAYDQGAFEFIEASLPFSTSVGTLGRVPRYFFT